MNVGSSKSPVAGRQINETKFSWLKTGKWDLWCSAAGLRGAPSPDLQQTLKKEEEGATPPMATNSMDKHLIPYSPFGYLILFIMCETWYQADPLQWGGHVRPKDYSIIICTVNYFSFTPYDIGKDIKNKIYKTKEQEQIVMVWGGHASGSVVHPWRCSTMPWLTLRLKELMELEMRRLAL